VVLDLVFKLSSLKVEKEEDGDTPGAGASISSETGESLGTCRRSASSSLLPALDSVSKLSSLKAEAREAGDTPGAGDSSSDQSRKLLLICSRSDATTLRLLLALSYKIQEIPTPRSKGL